VRVALVAAAAALVAVLVGLAFAGSRQRLAEGTHVAGVDVGGLSRAAAVARLDQRFAEVSAKPVAFVAGNRTFTFAADQLGVEPDWAGAVAAASRAGGGIGPVRGLRRLRTRVFGAEVLPRIAVSNGALEYALDRVASGVDRRPVSAALVLRGLRVETVPERQGSGIDRELAADVLVRSLGSLERGRKVALPVEITSPPVTSALLAPAAERARVALSGPALLRGAGRSWRLSRAHIAELLTLPRAGSTRLGIGGRVADGYFRALSDSVGRPPSDAQFVVSGSGVRIAPSREGLELDIPATAGRLLRAVTRPANRVAQLKIASAAPDRTTAEARAMGIDRRLSSYKTYYAGTSDRITNLQLGVGYLDGTLVRPGGTFSLNRAIGERTLERGFRPAPVILGTEYAEEVGGGTSQVATTVFNAAWEAGLDITERHPHSLYISRYQLGRDATVYWPSLDLKFVNDTAKWVLVKGFVEYDGISVAIYGGESRRVESAADPLVVTGKVPVERIEDPTLEKGMTVVEAEGSAPTRTSATRKVYAADGTLLRSETWSTSYDGETRVVRVGTMKPKPVAKTKARGAKPAPREDSIPGAASTTPPTRP